MVSVACSTATLRSLGHNCSMPACLIVFGFAMAFVWFKISNLIVPIRVSKEVELEGLDMPEMGAQAYPDFALNK